MSLKRPFQFLFFFRKNYSILWNCPSHFSSFLHPRTAMIAFASLVPLSGLGARAVSLMPPGQVIDIQHKVFHALKMCPQQQDAHMVTMWELQNSWQDFLLELATNGFLPIVTIWVASLLLFTWIMLSKY